MPSNPNRRIEAERKIATSPKEFQPPPPQPLLENIAKEKYDLLQANAQLVEKCKTLAVKAEEADKAVFENKSLKQTIKALSSAGASSVRKNSTPMSMEGRKMFER